MFKKEKRVGSLKMNLQLFAGPTRLGEIEKRKGEIQTLLSSEDDLTLDRLDELDKELRELDEEKSKLERRQKIAGGINTGTITANPMGTLLPSGGNTEQRHAVDLKWEQAIETPEYRSAWARDMMGIALEEEQRSMYDRVNVEYRDFTHNTENSAVLIPTTVSAGIWKRAEEGYPLWADVDKLRVRGNLTMKKSDGNAIDARWYDEPTKVVTDKLGFGTMDLTGCELAKAIEVTWKLKKMAVNDFVDYIIKEIGDRMGIALSYAVYAGRGKPGAGEVFKPEPNGIKTALANQTNTPQIIEYTSNSLSYTNLTAAMGGIHSSYAAGVNIYASNTTIWNMLATMSDAMGRPLFVTDVTANGVGRIFGRTIKPDASIPEGEILFGNPSSGYLANINEDITMYTEDHIRERITDYMGYTIVDGDVRDTKAFVILRTKVATA
ncbi:HK97 family phage major capsid protein [Paenibacillus sp. SORGH_AS306]|uniref:phage major capsid protein n=1 Tax=unclassified Paenibacillus TaxID=185978 RepID=UPI00278354A7|nr:MULTISPECIES: phage major capsid protein [unclassified Paenibacillus]MDQ1233343.1 HK97 family phage major capsid protein [Paenibacillus sp. SORGH_AS_0306]MDR6110384.1 HK97 family phage major capsid protein [Paenibacillus sp. SORGH_AS_0338]